MHNTRGTVNVSPKYRWMLYLSTSVKCRILWLDQAELEGNPNKIFYPHYLAHFVKNLHNEHFSNTSWCTQQYLSNKKCHIEICVKKMRITILWLLPSFWYAWWNFCRILLVPSASKIRVKCHVPFGLNLSLFYWTVSK